MNKVGMIILFCIRALLGDESPIDVSYKMVTGEDEATFYFTVKNNTDDIVIMNHLNSSRFEWQVVNADKSVSITLIRRMANSAPVGYVFLGSRELSFSLSSKKNHIVSANRLPVESCIFLELCSLKEFRKDGVSALQSRKIPLKLESETKPKPR